MPKIEHSVEFSKDKPLNLREELHAFDYKILLEALRQCEGNKAQAAKMLMCNRTTLVERLKKHSIDVRKIIAEIKAEKEKQVPLC